MLTRNRCATKVSLDELGDLESTVWAGNFVVVDDAFATDDAADAATVDSGSAGWGGIMAFDDGPSMTICSRWGDAVERAPLIFAETTTCWHELPRHPDLRLYPTVQPVPEKPDARRAKGNNNNVAKAVPTRRRLGPAADNDDDFRLLRTLRPDSFTIKEYISSIFSSDAVFERMARFVQILRSRLRWTMNVNLIIYEWCIPNFEDL